MSDIVERLRYATRDVVTGQRLDAGAHGHAPIEDLDDAADKIERLRAEHIEWVRMHQAEIDRANRARMKAEAERDALQLQIGELNDALGVIDHCQIKPLVDALRADAERYRWLRQVDRCEAWENLLMLRPITRTEDVDAAIDAARSKK